MPFFRHVYVVTAAVLSDNEASVVCVQPQNQQCLGFISVPFLELALLYS